MPFVQWVENRLKPTFDRLEKWTEEKRKAGEAKMEMLKKEMDMVDAEFDLKEAMEDLDEGLKRMQEEEEKNVDQEVEEDVPISEPVNESEKAALEAEEGEDEEEDDEITPSSFGSIDDTNPANGLKDSKSGKCHLLHPLYHLVPLKLRQSLIRWKESNLQKQTCPPPCDLHPLTPRIQISRSVSFPRSINKSSTLRYMRQNPEVECIPIPSSFRIHSKRNIPRKHVRDFELLNILSWHTPLST